MPEIEVTLVYPPHSEYVPYKKGQPRPKYSAKNKRVLLVRYDKSKEQQIKNLLPLWKKHLRRRLGPHSFPRVIPDEDAGSLTITRFREDCLVHTAASSCATKGFLSGVSNLDVRLTITVDDGTGNQNVSWSLRDVLMREKVGNKPLF